MTTPDYDDPKEEEKWCEERRAAVLAYLTKERIVHGRIGAWPAWHVAPYVSVWAVESKAQPDWVGWWVICGDSPTDYISAQTIKHPRAAISAISDRWFELAAYMLRGESHPDIQIGSPESWPQLGPLLQSRADTLADFASDDSVWQNIKH